MLSICNVRNTVVLYRERPCVKHCYCCHVAMLAGYWLVGVLCPETDVVAG